MHGQPHGPPRASDVEALDARILQGAGTKATVEAGAMGGTPGSEAGIAAPRSTAALIKACPGDGTA